MVNQNPNSTAVREPPPEIDRLSALPDVILEEILSHLPTSAAAATAVLSQRWLHLWTRVTRLHFDAADLFNTAVTLRTYLTTVDSVLRRFDSFSNVESFYFRFNLFDGEFKEDDDAIDFCSSYLMRWFDRICGSNTQRIDFADCNRKYSCSSDCFVRICIQNSVVAKTMNSVTNDTEFQEFELSNCFFCLPPRVFQSETLTEFILTHSCWFKLPESINLPNLKKFALRLCDFYSDLLRTLFKSLPSLEELTFLPSMPLDDHFIMIPAPCLKVFTVEYMGHSSRVEIWIDAPQLEHISITCCKSLVIRFLKIPSALSTAKLVFALDKFDGDDPDNRILEILRGISCVKSLELSSTLDALKSVAVDDLPFFENLVDLSLFFCVIHCPNFDIPVWVLRKAKSINIKVKVDDITLRSLECVLANTNVLERLCVSNYGLDDYMNLLQMENNFIEKLFLLPKASSRCEIEFDGLFVSATASLKNGTTIRQLY